jgi:hypothetical protein
MMQVALVNLAALYSPMPWSPPMMKKSRKADGLLLVLRAKIWDWALVVLEHR